MGIATRNLTSSPAPTKTLKVQNIDFESPEYGLLGERHLVVKFLT